MTIIIKFKFSNWVYKLFSKELDLYPNDLSKSWSLLYKVCKNCLESP